MKARIYKNLAIRSLWMVAAAMALAIQPLSAQARSYKVLYSFTNDLAAGEDPSSSLVRDPTGNLFGIALGGTFGRGIVFELSNTGQESVLYNFKGSDGDGDVPDSMSFRDSAGNLFGTTFQGGAYSFGTIFKLDTQGHETIVYNFCPKTPCTNGAYPGGVAPGKNGSLYGTTYAGGDYSCDLTGCGTVFKINHKGVQTFLHAFGGSDGQSPNAGLVLDESGNVYGTTQYGGASGRGAVFKVTAAGQESVEYSFTGARTVPIPMEDWSEMRKEIFMGRLTRAELTTAVRFSKLLRLASSQFCTISLGACSGANPYADLNLDQQGNILGVTSTGGTHNFGTIFKLDASGDEKVLHNFGEEGDAVHPSSLIIDASGNLYGTTYQSGKYNFGSVFEIVP